MKTGKRGRSREEGKAGGAGKRDPAFCTTVPPRKSRRHCSQFHADFVAETPSTTPRRPADDLLPRLSSISAQSPCNLPSISLGSRPAFPLPFRRLPPNPNSSEFPVEILWIFTGEKRTPMRRGARTQWQQCGHWNTSEKGSFSAQETHGKGRGIHGTRFCTVPGIGSVFFFC